MGTEQQHKQIIEQFYTAFQQRDATKMTSLYHDEVKFRDPAFGELRGEQAKKMWQMLIERGKKSLRINFYDVQATTAGGSATWEANYLFGKTKRPIHNIVRAKFIIDEGKIIKHTDEFNFWRWSAMALGTPGRLLGFTHFLKNKVRRNARASLEEYMAK